LLRRETDSGTVSDDRQPRAVAREPIAMPIECARLTRSTLVAPA